LAMFDPSFTQGDDTKRRPVVAPLPRSFSPKAGCLQRFSAYIRSRYGPCNRCMRKEARILRGFFAKAGKKGV
jgi:hypothetical protein